MHTNGKLASPSHLGALVLLAACGGSTSGPATTTYQLAFTQNPTSVAADDVITPAVQVELRDAQGHVATNAVDFVALRMYQKDSDFTAALLGSSYKQPVNGVVTFDDLHVDEARSGYVLTAHIGYGAAISSGAFDVAAGAPATLLGGDVVPVCPGAVEADVAVHVADNFRNGLPNMPVTFTVTSGGGSIASQTPSSGRTDSTGTSVAKWILGVGHGENDLAVHSSAVPNASLAFVAVEDIDDCP